MNEKKKLIQELIEMQKLFICKENLGSANSENYIAPEDDPELEGYQAKHDQLANRLIDIAHKEKGSKR